LPVDSNSGLNKIVSVIILIYYGTV